MLSKEFVPYEIALELIELGFDENCLAYYKYGNRLFFKYVLPTNQLIYAPLYQQAFNFFREKFQLTSWIYNSNKNRYFYTILFNDRFLKANELEVTYEEALNACLKKLIEIVKQKKDAEN